MAKWKIFEMRTVKPAGILKPARVRANILNALKEQGKLGRDEYFPLTTEYWVEPPDFGYTIKYAGGDIRLSIFPINDGSKSYKKWNWLNYGTRIRYAHMSEDWVSKTEYPGSLRTNQQGQGELMYVSKKAPPAPGIGARRWDKLIRKEMRKGFTKAINNAIKKGMSGK